MNTPLAPHKAALALVAPLLSILLALAPAGAAVTSMSSDLPLPDGFYESTSPPIHFSNPDPSIIDIELISLQLVSSSPITITPLPGGDELAEFDIDADFIFEITPLTGPPVIQPAMLTGPVQVITQGKTGNPTGTFDTEIISMNLTGNVGGIPIIIRESPTLFSQGQGTVTDIGGGEFQTESFFDVFFEISVNSGPFVPADAPLTLELMPEPSRVVLAFLGFAGIFFRRRRS